MTSDENPADTVVEQAAKVIQLSDRWSTRGIARALHDAGLLADPADRDELAKVREERDYHHARADVMLAKLSSSIALRGGKPGDFWKEWHKSHCDAVEAAERAEAEVAELRATVERVRALHTRNPLRDIPADAAMCSECLDDWPCPTSSALNGAGEG